MTSRSFHTKSLWKTPHSMKPGILKTSLCPLRSASTSKDPGRKCPRAKEQLNCGSLSEVKRFVRMWVGIKRKKTHLLVFGYS